MTFRALAARLATGPGAIDRHVANKSELLVAASDAVVARRDGSDVPVATPHDAIRAIALGVFDAIDAHPWVGAQLSGADDVEREAPGSSGWTDRAFCLSVGGGGGI